jgi:hypothetical protein
VHVAGREWGRGGLLDVVGSLVGKGVGAEGKGIIGTDAPTDNPYR